MQLIKHGYVKFNNKTYTGGMVLDTNNIYFFSNMNSSASTGMAVGGLLGYFIGKAIDKNRQKNNPDSVKKISDDIDFTSFSPEIQNKLKNVTLYEKLPRGNVANIAKTFGGVKITGSDGKIYSFTGKIHRRKILEYFQTHNYPIMD